MNSNLSIVTTADGSKTIYNPTIGEHYHSRHGALQESKHVFLQSGLKFFLEKEKSESVNILEVGFGTGLNFLLTADYCGVENIRLRYDGIEAYPLTTEVIAETGYGQFVGPELWKTFLEQYAGSMNKVTQLNSGTGLCIKNSKLADFESDIFYDVIYFDAFAAIHQPEMWLPDALEKCTRYLKPGGVFVTYAITGNLKRAMKSLNFSIEKAPGAPGKREMLRAVKLF